MYKLIINTFKCIELNVAVNIYASANITRGVHTEYMAVIAPALTRALW